MEEQLQQVVKQLYTTAPELRDILDDAALAERTEEATHRLLDAVEIDPLANPRARRCREALRVILCDDEVWKALRGLPNGGSGCSVNFLRELERLFAGLYSDADTHGGDFSAEAAMSADYLERYPDGLSREITRQRHKNRVRILNILGGTPSQWDDWLWQLRNAIDDVEKLARVVKLSDEERRGLLEISQRGVEWSVTPYYLSLFDDGGGNDRALRNRVLPRDARDETTPENATVEGGVHRLGPYSARITPHSGYAQFCIYRSGSTDEDFTDTHLRQTMEWFGDHPEVVEAVIAGGDLFCLDDSRVEAILAGLSRYKHIRRLRIDSSFPVVLPQRFTVLLTRILGRYIKPGKLEVALVTDFIHPYEVTQDVVTVIQRLSQSGIKVYNETPYSRDNTRRFEVVMLRRVLGSAGLINFTDVGYFAPRATGLLRVPLARILQEQSEEAALLPELERTAIAQLELGEGPRLPLHTERRLVGLRPEDGRRVYIFSDRGRSLRQLDAPLAEYLDYLAAVGEDPDDYADLWYYI